MLDKIKLALAGWSIRTFAGKYLRRGVRVGVSLLLGKALAAGVFAKLQAIGVQADPKTVELALDAALWTKLEALANLAKVKLEQSPRFKWLASLL